MMRRNKRKILEVGDEDLGNKERGRNALYHKWVLKSKVPLSTWVVGTRIRDSTGNSWGSCTAIFPQLYW